LRGGLSGLLVLCCACGSSTDDDVADSTRLDAVGEEVTDARLDGVALDSPTADSESEPDGGLLDLVGDSGDEDGDPADQVGPDAPADAADAEDDAVGDLFDDVGEVEISALTVTTNTRNVLSVFVEWQTSVSTATWLEVDCGADFRQTYAGRGAGTQHSVFVMGLLTGARCTARVRAGETRAERAFTVEPLPSALPALSLALQTPMAQPGWTLLNLSNHFDDQPLYAAIIDEAGRYRWYWARPDGRPGADSDVRVFEQGILVGGAAWPESTPYHVGWDGSVLWQIDRGMHHHLMGAPASNEWLVLGYHDPGCPSGRAGDTVELWDRETDALSWRSNICGHVDPEPLDGDWAHLNTIEPFDSRYYLISARNLNSVLRLDTTTGDLVWRLGLGGDFGFVEPEDDSIDPVFFRQHSPELQDDGNILLFDNGATGVREYSRALELAYDTETMEVWAVWEYRPSPIIFSPIWGDADRQPNGNTLITFGIRDTLDTSHVIEVDADGDRVWEVVLPRRWGAYRAERIVTPHLGSVTTE